MGEPFSLRVTISNYEGSPSAATIDQLVVRVGGVGLAHRAVERRREGVLERHDHDLREEDEIHFVGAYHYDDQTWGVYPGPWHVNHFSAVFAF